LNDYVPFYFTPRSIMLYNIATGFGGIVRREKEEIIIFVSSLYRLRENGIPFVFTNQHAYAVDTEFFDDTTHLDQIDWKLLCDGDFKTDDESPGKPLRYQAEALIHHFMPLEALSGIACSGETVRRRLEFLIAERGLSINVRVAPKFYFP